MSHVARWRFVGIFCLVPAFGCSSTRSGTAVVGPAVPVIAEQDRPLPSWMTPIVRAQMERERALLAELRWTAAALDYERTGQLAQGLAREVNCGHPADRSIPVDEMVPPPYIELQEELGRRAYHLAVVAARNDRLAVVAAYGAVVESCGRCHARYRTSGPPVELPALNPVGLRLGIETQPQDTPEAPQKWFEP